MIPLWCTLFADLEADLFEREVPLRPGEEYVCPAHVTFRAPGPVADGAIYVTAGRDAASRAVPVPLTGLRVVPSLRGELRIGIESVCTYELGTKADLT